MSFCSIIWAIGCLFILGLVVHTYVMPRLFKLNWKVSVPMPAPIAVAAIAIAGMMAYNANHILQTGSCPSAHAGQLQKATAAP